MKVTEIINEAGLAAGGANSGRGMAGPLRTLAAGNQRFKRMFTLINRRRAASVARGEKSAANMVKRLGPYVMLLRILGILTACYELWDDLDDADQLYQTGEIDEGQLRDFRQYYIGLFTTSMLVPLIAKIVMNSRYVVWIAKFITRLAGLGTGVFTMGASVAALIASEAFFFWLQKWLNSSAGQEWMKDWMTELIVVGTVPEVIWSKLTGYYDKADQKRTAAGLPSGKEPVDTDAVGFKSVKPDVAPVLIGGQRVTDAQGYLLPYAVSDMAVQAAIADPNSPAAKQFAAIPKRPQ